MNLEELVLPMKADDAAFKTAVAAATATVTAAVAAITLAVKATFTWADEMDGLQDVMGVTNKTAAALNFTLRKSGTNTDTLARGVVILSKGLIDANGRLDTAGKALKKWGIDALDANGVLKDQEVLLGEVATKYSEFSTQQEKVNFLTEVFGKSGADLIDFFDTLAAEGGIDAVTKKVEMLGLAIDPNRYEQFNRNLEEMKLIGLSLAVAFTEKVMPMLESLVKWAMEDGIPAFMDFKDRMVEAFESGGIGEALAVLDQQIATWLDNIDWAGYGDTFGDKIEEMLLNASGEIDIPMSLESLTKGISDFFIAAVGEENLAAFKNHFVDYVLLQLDRLNVEGTAKAKTFMNNFWAEHNRGLEILTVLWNGWSGRGLEIIAKWGSEAVAAMGKQMDLLRERIEAQLAAISEKFQIRARSWINKAVESFLGQKSALTSAIQGLVNEINAILKKVITSFTLSVRWPGSGTQPASTGSTGGYSTGTTGGAAIPRASGGPVIANKTYGIAEFFRPEVFTPATNGRVDSLQSNQPQGVMILNWDQFDVNIPRMSDEIVKAVNNT